MFSMLVHLNQFYCTLLAGKMIVVENMLTNCCSNPLQFEAVIGRKLITRQLAT